MGSQRSIVLYVAMSLDGYLADEKGNVDWLEEAEGDSGYADFLATVDTLIMGRTTYDQVLTFGAWPYAGKRCYVFTHREAEPAEGVEFVSGDVSELARRLQQEAGGRIWLVGGADLAAAFLDEALVEEFVITVIPIILGNGIPLFKPGIRRTRLVLMESRRFGELAQLEYRRG